MSETDFDSVGSSSETLSTDISSEGVSEKENLEENSSNAKGRKFRREKTVIVCLSVALVASILVVVALVVLIIFCRFYKPKNEVILNEPNEEEEGFEYPFYAPERDDGLRILEGSVRTPVPIEKPISIIADDGSQVMLIMGEENEVRQYAITADIYCCPPKLSSERIEDPRSEGCTLISPNQKFTVPGTDPERTKDDLTDAANDRSQEDNGFAMKFPAGMCPVGYDVTFHFWSVEQSGEGALICYGFCEPSKFMNFVSGNEELGAVDDISELLEVHKKYSERCYEKSESAKVFHRGKSNAEVEKEFHKSLFGMCQNLQTRVSEEIEGSSGFFSHFCTAGGFHCLLDPMDYRNR